MHHPAAETLLEYASGGCPVNTGKDWSLEMIEAMIARGPHVSALVPSEGVEQLWLEAQDKETKGQCRIVD